MDEATRSNLHALQVRLNEYLPVGSYVKVFDERTGNVTEIMVSHDVWARAQLVASASEGVA